MKSKRGTVNPKLVALMDLSRTKHMLVNGLKPASHLSACLPKLHLDDLSNIQVQRGTVGDKKKGDSLITVPTPRTTRIEHHSRCRHVHWNLANPGEQESTEKEDKQAPEEEKGRGSNKPGENTLFPILQIPLDGFLAKNGAFWL